MSVQLGNGVRFDVEFYQEWGDVDGPLITPTVVKFRVYDARYKMIEEIIIGPASMIEEGRFFCYWVPPADSRSDKYVIEWYGEISGLPSLKRTVLSTKFI